MGDNRLPNIDKLDGANWPIWKMQMMNYFRARDLWDMCAGTETVPVRAEGETQAAFDGRELFLLNSFERRDILGESSLGKFILSMSTVLLKNNHINKAAVVVCRENQTHVKADRGEDHEIDNSCFPCTATYHVTTVHICLHNSDYMM